MGGCGGVFFSFSFLSGRGWGFSGLSFFFPRLFSSLSLLSLSKGKWGEKNEKTKQRTFSGAPSSPSNQMYSARWARALMRTTAARRACGVFGSGERERHGGRGGAEVVSDEGPGRLFERHRARSRSRRRDPSFLCPSLFGPQCARSARANRHWRAADGPLEREIGTGCIQELKKCLETAALGKGKYKSKDCLFFFRFDRARSREEGPSERSSERAPEVKRRALRSCVAPVHSLARAFIPPFRHRGHRLCIETVQSYRRSGPALGGEGDLFWKCQKKKKGHGRRRDVRNCGVRALKSIDANGRNKRRFRAFPELEIPLCASQMMRNVANAPRRGIGGSRAARRAPKRARECPHRREKSCTCFRLVRFVGGEERKIERFASPGYLPLSVQSHLGGDAAGARGDAAGRGHADGGHCFLKGGGEGGGEKERGKETIRGDER